MERCPKSGNRGSVAAIKDQKAIDFGSTSGGSVVHAQPMSAARFKKGVTVPGVPSYVTSAFRGLYKEVSKHRRSGAVIDFNELTETFRMHYSHLIDAINGILNDISNYDEEALEGELHPASIPDQCPDANDACYSCGICRKRRKMLPSDIDLEHLQCLLMGLLDITFQNIFHTLVRKMGEPIGESPSPIHKTFRSFEAPAWDGWQECLKLYEKGGSEDLKFPLRRDDDLPFECPGMLAFQDRKVLDRFLDRVIVQGQMKHETYGIKFHFTTSLDRGGVCCGMCERTATYILPALVAPYFVLRQHRREQLVLNHIKEIGDRCGDGYGKSLLAVALKPIVPNYPELRIRLPEIPKRRNTTTKRTVLIEPNLPPYESLLLPTGRAPFVPRQVKDGIDKEKHPYSYFLSLSPEERKLYMKEKASRTRSAMGNPPVQPQDDTGGGEWKCGWFSLAEVGQKGLQCDSPDWEAGSVLNDSSKMTEGKYRERHATHRTGQNGEQSPVSEVHKTEDCIQDNEQTANGLLKPRDEQMVHIERMRGQNTRGHGRQTTPGGDVLETAITGFSNLQVQEIDDEDGMDVDVFSQDGEPEAQMDKRKKRRRKGKKKVRAARAKIDAATKEA